MAMLTRWEPLGIELPTWMTRLLDDRSLLDLERPPMRIEEYVEDDTFVVRVEVPDVAVEKDVDLSIHNGLLHIKAHRSESTEKKEKAFYRSEFRYGAFERTLALPPGATTDDVKATYDNGVLEIRVPTPSREAGSYKVPIQRMT